MFYYYRVRENALSGRVLERAAVEEAALARVKDTGVVLESESQVEERGEGQRQES